MRFKLFLCFILAFSLSLFGENKTITISGFVTDKEFRLGDATVCFFDSSNRVNCVKSGINGEFSIELPKNKYRITVKKDGYTSLVGDNFFVDYIFDPPERLVLNMTDNKIAIYGKVINNFVEPIKDAQVKVKIGEELLDINTNSSGIFFFQGHVGFISIFAKKSVFYGNGVSLLIQNEKFIINIMRLCAYLYRFLIGFKTKKFFDTFLYCLWTAEKEFKALMKLSVIERQNRI